ncbi:MAG: tryptophanase [Planctomycetes bacterium]|nr:tryptophanase [Planctomycetota bacterium]
MNDAPSTQIIEPFRIKVVEPLPFTTRAQRAEFLALAHHNVFLLRGSQVTMDLLTDSGTGAMSAAQWGAMMTGDETYAGSESFFELQRVVQDLTGMPFVIPTHQGRAAEHILFAAAGVQGRMVLANNHFDTTRANVEYLSGQAIDLVIAQGRDPQSEHPFKGNIDLEQLEAHLKQHGASVLMVLLTVTNNAGGGQPVSLENIRGAAALARAYGVPIFLDAARFAENAWMIKQREPGQSARTAREIASEMFGLVDGMVMSCKKDGLVNIGGLLCLRDPQLAERARTLLILTEGFPTYGGLAGRDLAALAVGLTEVTDEDYLRYRIASVAYLFRALDKIGMPLMRPAGGHAVYIDARKLYPHIKPHQLPGIALVNELYLEAGVRGVEVGTLMFGRAGAGEAPDPSAPLDLVRLAFPRRTYTQSHVDWLIDVLASVHARRAQACGYKILHQAEVLRAFTAHLAPLAHPGTPGDAHVFPGK